MNLNIPFPRITYHEVIERYPRDLTWGDDIPSAIEQDLATKVAFGQPLFITHYPTDIKFFNMRNNPEKGGIVNSADLILPWSGESVGSAERIHEKGMLVEKLKDSTMMRQLEKCGVGMDAFTWYIDSVAHNKPGLHSGCGFGLNRVTQYVIGRDDIRLTTPFPVNAKYML